jgi:hypothetical protein
MTLRVELRPAADTIGLGLVSTCHVNTLLNM